MVSSSSVGAVVVSSADVLSLGFTSSSPASVVASGTMVDVSSVASVESIASVTSVGSEAFSVVSGSFSSVSTSASVVSFGSSTCSSAASALGCSGIPPSSLSATIGA